MNDELTAVDIQKMQDEIKYRQLELRPKILEDVKTAREFGDLSENFEYKAAKQEKRRNDSRIRYLAVSYTHLTLPTNREVESAQDAEYSQKKNPIG